MKTEADLLRDFTRWLLTTTGASEAEIELRMKEFDSRFTTSSGPAALDDGEYAAKLELMKKEAPAYLYHLRKKS